MATQEDQDAQDLLDMNSELEAGLASELGPSDDENQDLDGAGKGPLQGEEKAASGAEAPAADKISPSVGGAAPAATSAPSPEAPSAWKREVQPLFAALPPEVKAEIMRREQDISRYIGENGPYVKVGQVAQQFFSNYQPLCNKLGVNPWNVTAELWTRYANFSQAEPQQKLDMLVQFAHENGIQLQLAGASRVDDGTMALRRDVASLRDGQTAISNMYREARIQELSQSVDAFASDPKNEFFDKVGDRVALLIRSGQCKTLPEAYETACRLDPEVAAILVDREADRRVQERDTKNAERVKAAKASAAANVRMTPGRGSNRSASTDWMNDLAKTYDQIQGDS